MTLKYVSTRKLKEYTEGLMSKIATKNYVDIALSDKLDLSSEQVITGNKKFAEGAHLLFGDKVLIRTEDDGFHVACEQRMTLYGVPLEIYDATLTGTPKAPTPTQDTSVANKAYVDGIIDKIYPVGSVYVSETDPSTLLGGTWEQNGDVEQRKMLWEGSWTGAVTTLTIEGLDGHDFLDYDIGAYGGIQRKKGIDLSYRFNGLTVATSSNLTYMGSWMVTRSGDTLTHVSKYARRFSTTALVNYDLEIALMRVWAVDVIPIWKRVA